MKKFGDWKLGIGYSYHKQEGFTLVELLIVISIIGILAGLIVVNFGGARARARDTTRKSDFKQLKTALRLYYNDYQIYPDDSGGSILGCGADGQTACTWGEEFSAGSGPTKYMTTLPVDPLNTGSYVYSYQQADSGDGFQLRTYLENLSDEADGQSQVQCGLISDVGDKTAGLYVACQD